MLSPRSDLTAFILFLISVAIIVVSFDIGFEFLLLYVVPLVAIAQPCVWLMGGLQHGPRRTGARENVSRTIRGSKLNMWRLLLLDVNFHAEHHLDPSVPHYWLRKKSHGLLLAGEVLWSESYIESLRSLFRR
ncbi:MAG: fatty acid desaturase [Deltaproteobacteria bacterium]|nr:fatty acid desaturase [Deltaproteobacteria bacterium]